MMEKKGKQTKDYQNVHEGRQLRRNLSLQKETIQCLERLKKRNYERHFLILSSRGYVPYSFDFSGSDVNPLE